ncbi:transposase domain-containing protein [Rhizobium sp. SL86]|uniref:transposase domain-containing protein n=1 Tax=Rhizobium sp. SL86 TaxID=2995148 RepID=UPI002273655F|nr:transposase domain-containing protein [Rhizobium sp. SL86]MCY1669313.1 Mu transposase C-terminal domain-containing protein [Rhizobium sp. SL86]
MSPKRSHKPAPLLPMKEFFSVAELAEARLPDLPRDISAIDKIARAHWRGDERLARRVPGKTKPVWEYHYSLLPRAAQTRLLVIHTVPANDDRNLQKERKSKLWHAYEALSSEHKILCEARLKALQIAEDLEAGGMTSRAAVTMACARAGVTKSAFYEWRKLVAGHAREDWLAALAPSYNTETKWAECHQEAWDILKSDYLRPERPTFSACYRRVVKLAKTKKWSPIPTERALRRRFDHEVPEAVQIAAREGREKAKALYPAQRRSRADLHAMQAVNMDGHKFDVFVRFPDGRIGRVFMIALQDLYSGKFVAWRISDSENKETVRLVIGDMVERYGIPDIITLDNGRAFASKWITGRSPTRYRFKIRDEDPQGLLTTLGIDLRFTKPYSGQSKPIERAFRDLTDDISRHPVCAGAYTGNKPEAKPDNYGSSAVPLDTFVALVNDQMAEHNARTGRKGGNCDGRSFDETFNASMAEPGTIVRTATAAQRSLWLLAAEGFTARKPNGEIHLHGNRYWSPALTGYAGKKVIIRFDPEQLHRAIKVYDLKDMLICEAECIEDSGFYDAEAARRHEKARGDYRKAIAAEKATHARLTARQLADLYSRGIRNTPPAPEPNRPKVTRIVPSKISAQPALPDDAAFEDSFSRALTKISGGSAVIQFPQGDRSRK